MEHFSPKSRSIFRPDFGPNHPIFYYKLTLSNLNLPGHTNQRHHDFHRRSQHELEIRQPIHTIKLQIDVKSGHQFPAPIEEMLLLQFPSFREGFGRDCDSVNFLRLFVGVFNDFFFDFRLSSKVIRDRYHFIETIEESNIDENIFPMEYGEYRLAAIRNLDRF